MHCLKKKKENAKATVNVTAFIFGFWMRFSNCFEKPALKPEAEQHLTFFNYFSWSLMWYVNVILQLTVLLFTKPTDLDYSLTRKITLWFSDATAAS